MILSVHTLKLMGFRYILSMFMKIVGGRVGLGGFNFILKSGKNKKYFC